MKILVTGAKGFIGRNLVVELRNQGYQDILEFDASSTIEQLVDYTKVCDFVFHLAGVNRPKNPEDFMKGNADLTSTLLNLLVENKNCCPVLITSSIQARGNNPYGVSKRAGEELLFEYGRTNRVRTCVYQLPNVFGKWCRPNYNSVVATFCHNIANDIAISINDPNAKLQLVYIDDVIEEFIRALHSQESRQNDYAYVPVVHQTTVGEVAELLYSFKDGREGLSVPKVDNPFIKSLYSTYLSYIPADKMNYPLMMHRDDRGVFTEIIRTADRGQFSVNITKPGITKGNHWHHTKNEKFVVVSGNGLIQMRQIGTEEIIDYYVSGDNMQVVDIPVGYTHSITNTGETDLITFMWANEPFNSEKPDTFFEEVQ